MMISWILLLIKKNRSIKFSKKLLCSNRMSEEIQRHQTRPHIMYSSCKEHKIGVDSLYLII